MKPESKNLAVEIVRREQQRRQGHFACLACSDRGPHIDKHEGDWDTVGRKFACRSCGAIILVSTG